MRIIFISIKILLIFSRMESHSKKKKKTLEEFKVAKAQISQLQNTKKKKPQGWENPVGSILHAGGPIS